MASQGTTTRLLTLALMLATLAVFAPVVRNGIVWDDHRLLESDPSSFLGSEAWKNAFTTDFWHGADAGRAGGDHRLYRPLLKTVLIAQYRIFSTAVPAGYHFVSLVLHLLNGLLVFRWLRRRLDATAPVELIGVFAGALLFSVHPTRAESVGWISAGSDLWATFFALLALEAWDRGSLPFATLGFVTALLFKESSAAVPLALAVDAFWLAPDAAERRKRWMRVAVPVGAVIAVFVGRMLIVPLKDGGSLSSVGARQDRFFATVAQFARMALWPVHPTTQVGYIESTAFGGEPTYPSSLVIGGALTLIVLLALALLALRRPHWRPAMADLSWFWVLALPALNLIPLAGIQFTGERFLYLPLLGLVALVTRGLVGEVRRADSRRRIALVGVSFVLVTFGFIARAHAKDFVSDLTLWSSERLRNPKNGLVLEGLYTSAMEAQQYDLAVAAAGESFVLQPSPRGKAYMFVEWLRARTESVKDDARALKQLREDADSIARGGHPVGQSGWLLQRIPSEGAEWMRAYSMLAVTRAWLALRTLDFEGAVELAKVAQKDPMARASAWRCAVLARVAQGKWDLAEKMVNDPRAPERWAGLVDRRGNEHLSSRVATLFRLNEPSLARRLALDGLAADPKANDLVHLLVTIDLQLRLYPEARRFLLGQPMDQATWVRPTLESVARAEAAHQ